MAEVSLAIRKQVEARAERRCEYCLCPMDICSADYTVDHIIPRVQSGSDELDNLALCCQGCNNRKYTATTAIDPVTGDRVPLFHPRQDRWEEHFLWSENGPEVIGTTPTGRATCARLQLNRLPVQNLRRAVIALQQLKQSAG